MEYLVKPWAHQLAAINQAKDRDSFALFFEQGCGKTSTTINILRHKYQQEGRLLRTLILCPQIVIENWKAEFAVHSTVPQHRVLCLRGPQLKRIKLLSRETQDNSDAIVVTNYEALSMPNLFQWLEDWGPEVLVLDESHKIKDISAKRTKKAVKLALDAKYRYILTGTPILNSLFDIFPQFLALDKGQTFGERFNDFRAKYFVDYNAGRPKQTYFPDWQPRMNTPQEINRLIYQKAMRVTKKECLDLPELVRQTVNVELSDEQKRVYKELEQDAVSFISNTVVSADLVIKKALRLQQVVTGYVPYDDGGMKVFRPNPRLMALREIIEQISPEHKFIVWAVFKQNYNDIRWLLKDMDISAAEVHGEVTPLTKISNLAAFTSQTSGVRALIANPASCGIGANLTIASYAIFYSRNFSMELDLQAEARNHRGGSEVHEKITRIDIVAKNTIDELVVAALKDKCDVSETILKHIRSQNASNSAR